MKDWLTMLLLALAFDEDELQNTIEKWWRGDVLPPDVRFDLEKKLDTEYWKMFFFFKEEIICEVIKEKEEQCLEEKMVVTPPPLKKI